MKRVSIILAFLVLQLFLIYGVAQEIAPGNQIAIDLELTEPIEYMGYRFQDPIPAGTRVYWNFEVTTSGAKIGFFIMNQGNWTILQEDTGAIDSIHGMYEVDADTDNIQIPYYGHWYFVFRNPEGQDSSVSVTGGIALGEEPNTTTPPPPGEIDPILVTFLVVIGVTMVSGAIAFKKWG